MKIAVLIASYNRVATTLRGLESLVEAAGRAPALELEVFLVDDASPDNTGAAVKARFPATHLITGNGKLFWNRGMCRAYQAARASGILFDAYLLFNDDVVLDADGLDRMAAAFRSLNAAAPAVVTGAMRSAATGQITYHGFFLNSKHDPLRPGKPNNSLYLKAFPNGAVQECDTFHGNCVMIPAGPMQQAGGLDPRFHHMHGDTILGMKLRAMGCKTFLMPDAVGFCERDARAPAAGSFARRLRAMFQPPQTVMDEVHMAFRLYPFRIAAASAALHFANRLKKAAIPHSIRQRLHGVQPPDWVSSRPFLEALARDSSNAMRPRNWKISTFLVSFPKSGRTWLELMLAHGFARRYGLEASDLSRDLLLTRQRAGAGPVIFTTHDWSEVVGEKVPAVSPHLLFAYPLRLRYWGRRVLMLIRDPRDTIVSNFYQSTQRSYFPLSFTDIDDYVLHPLYGFPRLVRFYKIWALNRHFVRAFKLVTYEALMQDGPATLRSIFEFTGLGKIDEETARGIYDICTMNEMRKLEAAGEAGLLRFAGPQASKARRGVVGGYRDELKPETIEKLNRMMAQIPRPFRYPV